MDLQLRPSSRSLSADALHGVDSLIVLIVLVVAFAVSACRAKESTPDARVPRRPAARSAKAAKGFVPPPHLTTLMGEIQKVAEEMQRRAVGSYPMTAPALMMAKRFDEIPVDRFPPSFATHLAALRLKLKALETTREHGKDLSGLLDLCQACHREFSPRGVTIVQSLRAP